MGLMDDLKKAGDEETQAYLYYLRLADDADEAGMHLTAKALREIAEDELKHSATLARLWLQPESSVIEEPRIVGYIPPEEQGRFDLYRVVAYGTEGGVVAFTNFDHDPAQAELAAWTISLPRDVNRVYVFSPDGTEKSYTFGELAGEPRRPFPQTYMDWYNLGEDIKRKMPREAGDTINNLLQVISEGGPEAEEAKRWLMEKAGELGIR